MRTKEAIITAINEKIENIIQEIEDFEIKGNGDCKKLQAMCNEKQRLISLLNLAQSDQLSIPNREIFGVNL